jgi:hypothetical protein
MIRCYNLRNAGIFRTGHQVHDDDRRIGQMRQKHSVIKLSDEGINKIAT